MNWETRVTELLNIQLPIIQGGLAHLANSELAAAVSNAGGPGQITAMSLESPAALKQEIMNKKRLVEGSEKDTVVIKRSLGAPGRVISNSWTSQILEIEKEDGGYEQLKDYISGKANKRYVIEGKEDDGYGWAGQVMGLIKDVPTVQELFTRMISEGESIRRRWAVNTIMK